MHGVSTGTNFHESHFLRNKLARISAKNTKKAKTSSLRVITGAPSSDRNQISKQLNTCPWLPAVCWMASPKPRKSNYPKTTYILVIIWGMNAWLFPLWSFDLIFFVYSEVKEKTVLQCALSKPKLINRQFKNKDKRKLIYNIFWQEKRVSCCTRTSTSLDFSKIVPKNVWK